MLKLVRIIDNIIEYHFEYNLLTQIYYPSSVSLVPKVLFSKPNPTINFEKLKQPN